ncbi:MAG TPA: hypothetical protein VGB98_04120 [Pyrinomonadaceae bacterium]|jgi:hypothetical protein
MRKSLTLFAAVVALALCAGAAGAQEKRRPSTPEQLRHAVETATLLENDPLHKDAKKLREQLLFFIIQAPDIQVTLCPAVLGDHSNIKGDYASIITGQLVFSTAKFLIEHPEQAGDNDRTLLAGVEGVLRVYQNIRKAKPKVEIKPLEALLVKQQAGGLADSVMAAAAAGCKSQG